MRSDGGRLASIATMAMMHSAESGMKTESGIRCARPEKMLSNQGDKGNKD